jgi:hypothetical protein
LINSFLHPVAADTGEERTFCKKKKSRSKERMIDSSEKKNVEAAVASAKEPDDSDENKVQEAAVVSAGKLKGKSQFL